MMKQNQIILNNVIYTQSNLKDLLIADEPKDSWRNAIYYFLQNWFDDTDFIIAYTSGSTGKPKEIRLKKQSMINSACMTNEFFGMDNSKTALLCLPASYIAGKMMLVRAIAGGYNLLAVEPKANPFQELDVEIDFTAITPYQLNHSLGSLNTKKVAKIIVGGGAVHSKLEDLSKDIPAELYETYGMTETCSHIALRRFNGSESATYFTILDGVSIRKDNRECLVIRAPHLLDAEIVTNDIVELKDEKSFRWLGRFDSVINSGGVKIHPELVEKKLERIISNNYFISSVPDPDFENKVVIVIESNKYSDSDIKILNSRFREILSKYEIPKQVCFLPEFIYSQSNKILKAKSLDAALKNESSNLMI